MITCGNCGKPLHTDEAVILWKNKYVGGKNTVTAFLIVHYGRCDDRHFENSAGAVYVKNWHPDEDSGFGLKDCIFAIPEDKTLLEELIEQRRKDHRPGESKYEVR